jgi:FMN-dependent NADH-azoreductase
LAENFDGIRDVIYIKAEGLDIYGANVPKILENVKQEIDEKL